MTIKVRDIDISALQSVDILNEWANYHYSLTFSTEEAAKDFHRKIWKSGEILSNNRRILKFEISNFNQAEIGRLKDIFWKYGIPRLMIDAPIETNKVSLRQEQPKSWSIYVDEKEKRKEVPKTDKVEVEVVVKKSKSISYEAPPSPAESDYSVMSEGTFVIQVGDKQFELHEAFFEDHDIIKNPGGTVKLDDCVNAPTGLQSGVAYELIQINRKPLEG